MFNSLDIFIIIILFLIFLYGLYKGIISITVPIIAIIITFIIAPLIYNFASKYFNHSIILKIISFIVSYSMIRIILSKVEDSIKKLLKIIFLGWVDRLIGAIVLTFIACIIIAFISSIILSMPEEYENINKIIDIINNSKILMSINNFFKISFYIEKIFI